ncbi:hypothetical protein ACIOVF_19105 [Pseudomonas sp. NPDC087612]|uniref:hypothetical protein n=1 Tax=Pseudomonas sp. NPDC087612 TaxID=3364441 RepID=UPI00382C6050
MEGKHQNLVILDWTAKYLRAGYLREPEYDQALAVAERLQHSGLVSTTEWTAMVRQANAALLMFAEGEVTKSSSHKRAKKSPQGRAG